MSESQVLQYFVYGALPVIFDSIVVVGTLTCNALLHFMCDLTGTQMNVKCILIQDLHECELDNNTAETTKNICRMEGQGAVDLGRVSIFSQF